LAGHVHDCPALWRWRTAANLWGVRRSANPSATPRQCSAIGLNGTLTGELLRALPDGLRSTYAQLPDVEQRLRSFLDAGRQAWPDVTLEPALFIAYVGERLAQAKVHGARAMAQMRASDLYLACGLARGDRAAQRYFEACFVPEMAFAIGRRFGAVPAAVDEVLQTLRTRFLHSEDERPPAIVKYSGRGQLKRWLRVVTARMASRLLLHPPAAVAAEARVLDVEFRSDPGLDPESFTLKSHYRDAFQQALKDAIKSLSQRDRKVLALHVLKDLDLTQIGAVLNVHRSTVGRWLARAHEQIHEEVRRRLSKLGLSTGDVDSIRRLVESQIELSLKAIGPAATHLSHGNIDRR